MCIDSDYAGLRWVLSPRSCTASHSKILLWTPCLPPPSPSLVFQAPPPPSPAGRPPDPGACRTSRPCSWIPDSGSMVAAAALILPVWSNEGDRKWMWREELEVTNHRVLCYSFMRGTMEIRTQRLWSKKNFKIALFYTCEPHIAKHLLSRTPPNRVLICTSLNDKAVVFTTASLTVEVNYKGIRQGHAARILCCQDGWRGHTHLERL